MKRICTVYSTTDYSIFKTLKGNRKINLHNLNRIKNSMSYNQLISPIIVNEKGQIIDGQHRYEAQKELELPVYYMKIDGYGLPEVQILNTNSSNWTKKEYLESYCERGFKHYLKLKEFMSLYPQYTLQNCIALLSDDEAMKIEGTKVKVFEEGQFKIKDWEFAIDSAEKLMMVKPFYEGYKRRSFVGAMIKMFSNKKYNHADFIGKLRYKSVELQDCTNMTQYTILIEEIYNYRRVNKINLRYANAV